MEGKNAEVQSTGPERDTLLDRVIVVQPDPQTLEVFGDRFKPCASIIQLFSKGEDALDMVQSEEEKGMPPVSLVVTDYRLPGGKDGFDVIKGIRDRYPDSIRVMYSGKASDLSRLNEEELVEYGITHMYDPHIRRPSEVVDALIGEVKKRQAKEQHTNP